MEEQNIAGIPGTRKREDFTFLVRLLDLSYNVYLALLWAMNEGDVVTQQNKLLTWLFRTQKFHFYTRPNTNLCVFEDVSRKTVLYVITRGAVFLDLNLGFGGSFGQINWKTPSFLQTKQFYETVHDSSCWPCPCEPQDEWWPDQVEITRERFFTILYHFLPKWP